MSILLSCSLRLSNPRHYKDFDRVPRKCTLGGEEGVGPQSSGLLAFSFT